MALNAVSLHVLPHHSALHCAPGKVQEHLPDDFHLGILILFPFASRRKPQEEAGAALALCSAMHFDCCRGTRDIRLWMQKGTLGPALAALCGMLPQPIQVSKPSKGPPSLWLLLRGSVPRRGTKEHRGRVIGLSAPSTHLYPSGPAGQVLGLPPPAPSQTSGLGQ